MEGPINPNGGLIICHKCGKILGRRKGIGQFAYINKDKRQHIPVDLESDNIKISCRDCKTGHIFISIKEGIGFNEEFKVKKESAPQKS